MSWVNLEFPVFVRFYSDQKIYQLSPLFVEEPVARKMKFNKALASLNQSIRKELKGLQHLKDYPAIFQSYLWFTFQPEVRHFMYKCSLESGQHWISGSISVCTFSLKDQLFIYLPSVEQLMWVFDSKDRSQLNIDLSIEFKLLELFRKNRKKYGKDWKPDHLFAATQEFIISAQIPFYMSDQKNLFSSHQWFDFLTMFGGSSEFSGAQEVEKVAHNLNDLYPHQLLPAFERELWVQELKALLFRDQNLPVVILGESGVGKTRILKASLFEYLKLQKEKNIKTRYIQRMWHLDPLRVISGMSIVGMWQNRFESILDHIARPKDRRGHSPDLLFIDQSVALFRVGKSQGSEMTLSTVLKSYLENKSFQIIIEATPSQWNLIQELDRNFTDLFTVVRVESASVSESVRMMNRERVLLEQETLCQFTLKSLTRIFYLQQSFMKQQALPGSLLNFIKGLAHKYTKSTITEEIVLKAFGEQCQLNSKIFNREIPLDHQELEQMMTSALIGQPEASQALIEVVHLIKAGLNHPKKPISAFLFTGPTGVGKTEAAKLIARYLFNNEDQIIRFDMNEYIDAYSVSRLIGDESNSEGLLTGQVRYRPFCVLLLDEIEKAHPLVHDLLLQLLGEGRLSNALGQTIDFTNTIVIMTSNVGAKMASKVMGFEKMGEKAGSLTNSKYQKALEEFFRPEFINRIDRVILFKRLNQKDILAIAQIQIQKLFQREGFLQRSIILNISQEALEFIAQKGFDPMLGGRALKRAIDKELVVLSAEQLVLIHFQDPILFEMTLEDQELRPYIIPLPQLQRQPYVDLSSLSSKHDEQVSQLSNLKDISTQLIDELNGFLDRLVGLESHVELNTYRQHIFNMRELLSDIKEELEEFLWTAEQPSFSNYIPTKRQFPLKVLDKKWRSITTQDPSKIYEYMEESVRTATHLLGSETIYTKNLIKLGFYRSQIQYLADRDQRKRVCVHVCSLLQDQGTQEIAHQINIYQEVAKDLGVTSHVHVYSKDYQVLICEQAGIAHWFGSERGIHMYYPSFQLPIPLYVQLDQVHIPSDQESNMLDLDSGWIASLRLNPLSILRSIEPSNPIHSVRLYAAKHNERRHYLMTDLRTDCVLSSQNTTFDWHMLLYTLSQLKEGDT